MKSVLINVGFYDNNTGLGCIYEINPTKKRMENKLLFGRDKPKTYPHMKNFLFFQTSGD